MDILSSVGASCARDLTEKTLTSVNENQNQNRKLNRPAMVVYTGCIFINNVIALYYISISKPSEKEVGLQPKIDEHRFSILR